MFFSEKSCLRMPFPAFPSAISMGIEPLNVYGQLQIAKNHHLDLTESIDFLGLEVFNGCRVTGL